MPRLGILFRTRFEYFQRKFLTKFVNNLLAQVTPFLFYTVGGYLVIVGRLDIGALVAVIAAYKDLPDPVKELIDWDQERLDVSIKYGQVIEQFSAEDITPAEVQRVLPTPELPRRGSIDGCEDIALAGRSFPRAENSLVVIHHQDILIRTCFTHLLT